MVAYSFKSRFVEPIAAGRKRQTIRNDRKRHARPGEELQLYTAMRTKQCRLIARAVCFAVTPIRIEFFRLGRPMPSITIGDRLPIVARDDRNSFAHKDGFAHWDDMADFWRAEHGTLDVFSGVLIEWTPPRNIDQVPT